MGLIIHKVDLGWKNIRTTSLYLSFLIGIIFFLIPLIVNSQTTRISGKVINRETHQAIPFANIFITNTRQGTLTDFEGEYFIEIKGTKPDSIRASLIGFSPITKPIRVGASQTVNFKLSSQNEELPEVVIEYTGNPADDLIDSIIKYKDRSAFQQFKFRQFNSYTKAHIGINNLSEEFFERKLLEPFEFIGTYKDTSDLNGKTYIPVMISESQSTVYERKEPKSKKEIITASRISGLEHTNVSQYMGNLIMEVNIYENHLDMFEKNFISPISNNGHDYYRYYLVDSAFIDSRWCYNIKYKPRRKQELAFSGNLWVNDTSFAIMSINLRIADDANLNFVNDLLVEQEFRWTDEKYWIITKDKLLIDFNIVRKSNTLIGAYGERTNFYSDFVIDTIEKPGVFKNPTDITVASDALKLNDDYWENVRPELLNSTETGIYHMIDSVKSSPSFKKYKTIAIGLASGYFPLGNFEIGSLYKLFSYNSIEGARFRIGGRTSQNLSRKFRIGGYLAYGTLDDRFKYGVDAIYLFNKNPRRALSFSFKYDLEQLGLSATGRPTDNILSSFFSKGPIDKLTMVREYKLSYNHEWYNGLINTVHLNRKELFPPGDTKFVLFPESQQDTVLVNSITTTEVGLDTRISFKEHIVEGKFKRMTIKSEYPIITLKYRFGIPHAAVNDYNYHKLNLSVSQWFNLGMIGWSRFYVEGGKIWGTLPYPLLKIHDGNQTWLFDQYSSNMMNFYEFVSDQYVHLYYTHHFLGLLLNKLPLIRRLEMREVVHFRVLYGSVSDKNIEFSEFPRGLRPFGNEPYIEAGAGLENIFKFFRIDAIWRLTHLNDPGSEPVSKFGIFASLYFSF